MGGPPWGVHLGVTGIWSILWPIPLIPNARLIVRVNNVFWKKISVDPVRFYSIFF